MKRICAFFCLALTLLMCLTAAAEEANLIANGGFETLDASGNPKGWYPTAYRTQEGYSRIAITSEKAHSGQYSAVVENASANDARYTCTVSVEPSSLYRLSAYVLVDSMEDTGNGANLGIEGIYSYSDCLFDTGGEWRYLEWYGETGEDQREVTFGVRVGGYGAESTGKAYFDDVRLEKVDALPSGVFASVWYDTQSYVSYDTATTQQTGQKSTALFVVLGVLFGFAGASAPFAWGRGQARRLCLCLRDGRGTGRAHRIGGERAGLFGGYQLFHRLEPAHGRAWSGGLLCGGLFLRLSPRIYASFVARRAVAQRRTRGGNFAAGG